MCTVFTRHVCKNNDYKAARLGSHAMHDYTNTADHPSLHYREPRQGRNPRTGDAVELRGKHVPHFKPGKELRERVNRSVKTGF